MEITLPEDNTQIFASKYQTVLPQKEELKALLTSNLMTQLAQGVTRYNMSKSAFNDAEIILPTLSEQRAISNILSGMDAEIAALEAKRQKYQAVKQGMMQALPSGKVRI